MPTIIKRSGSFLAQVRVKGFKPAAKTFRIETTTKAARTAALGWATALEKELRQESGRGTTRRDTTQLSIGDLIREFLAEPEIKRLRTYPDIDRLLTWWLGDHAATRILDFGVVSLRAAREKLSRGRAPATVNRHLSALRSAWNWGIVAGLIPQERAWPKRLLLKEPRGRVRFLSDEEISRVLKAADSDPLMRAAIVISIATGLRQGELLRLTWGAVDFEKQTITVHESKTNERRATHLTASAVESLKAMRKATVVSPMHVFVVASGRPLKKSILEARWYKIRTAAGLTDFRWHDLRHTCASILLQNGATLAMVSGVLGHRSPSMTQRYAHLVQGAAVTGHDKLDAKLRGRSR